MKRDMDLVRKILITIEKYDSPSSPLEFPFAIENYTEEQIEGHLLIMQEGGLVNLIPVSTRINEVHLTWAGFEFLDLARKDSFWEKAKAKVSEATGGLAIEALKIALSMIVTQALKGSP